ncbi:hypothetical protein GCM10010222_52020 [Streptomyces tanashiensis]|nr:hypothetical protein GCM10010222_52020 [Streptomyces tanashiensis]
MRSSMPWTVRIERERTACSMRPPVRMAGSDVAKAPRTGRDAGGLLLKDCTGEPV